MYISTKTILQAYNQLSNYIYKNQSILYTFLIMKGLNYDNLEFKDVDIIKESAYEYAWELGGLFSPLEKSSQTHEFINPFNMKSWSNNPTEPLKKWVSSRVKNNIIGGATTWRQLILIDDNNIKYRNDYIETIKNLTLENNRMNLVLLAIWSNRFTKFNEKVTISNLIENFINRYNISKLEINTLFESKSIIQLEFSEHLHDTTKIRDSIGNPTKNDDWLSYIETNENKNLLIRENIRRYNTSMTTYINIEKIEELLLDYHQLILTGPPGTSKSFFANVISKNFHKTVNIQFHPQYSYQQFIGGYVVKGTDVVYELGVLSKLIEEAKNNVDKSYLLIIDEINRANLSQVFGEIINCLDRETTTSILINGDLKKFTLPKNINIIGTMNTTDRTLGRIDFALKRRFMFIYLDSKPNLLNDLCIMTDDISLSDFLIKINNKLVEVTNNKDFVIGHAYFFHEQYKNKEGKYEWNLERLYNLFYFRILPLINDFCHNDQDKINLVVGEDLSVPKSKEEFSTLVRNYLLS